jgi:hypothetical protein
MVKPFLIGHEDVALDARFNDRSGMTFPWRLPEALQRRHCDPPVPDFAQGENGHVTGL